MKCWVGGEAGLGEVKGRMARVVVPAGLRGLGLDTGSGCGLVDA